MKLLALEKEMPNITAKQFEPHLKPEAMRVWELYQKDFIREIYFRGDRKEAVLILECSGVKEAEKILASLPMVKAGLIEFELIPLVPYPGFLRLFKEGHQ